MRVSGRRPEAVSVSVVICAYTERRWDDLVAAVASVREQDYPAADVVLVIDHNSDLLARCRARYLSAFAPDAWPNSDACPVRVVSSTGRPGLSGARNTGLVHATGDVVAFLDDDAVAAAGWLTELVAPFTDTSVHGVGGAVLPMWADHRPRWFPTEFDWVVGCAYTGLPEVTAEIRNPIGAAMSVRRSAVDVIGGFDEGIGRLGTVPLGCEETEFFIRLRSAVPGARVLFAPRAVVHHKVGAERGRWSYFRRRCYAEGRSKALVAARVGSRPALAAERTYVRRVLPRAVLRELASGGRPDRAAAVVAGLTMTAFGYLRGRVSMLRWPGCRRPAVGEV